MLSSILLGWFGTTEIIVIILIILLLFGARKIPEMFKGVGQGIKEFKKATDNNDDDKDKKTEKKEE